MPSAARDLPYCQGDAGSAGAARCAGYEHAVSILTTSNTIQIETKIALFREILLLTSLNSDCSNYGDDL